MKNEPEGVYRYFPSSPRDRKWGVYVTTVGEWRIAPHSGYPPPGHPKGYAFDWQRGRTLHHYALVYISGGRGRFEDNRGHSYEIKPGNVILLFPGVWHRYMPDPETGWHEHWIAFDGKTARDWEANGFISRKRAVWTANAEDALRVTFSGIFQAVRANRPALQQIMAGATCGIIALLYSAQQSGPARETLGPNVVEKAIAHFQTELANEINVQELARKLGVSYRWFRSRFTRHVGMSPHQYLIDLRILRARNLLAETDLKIQDIALQTGFNDEHYFSRMFRCRTGVPPGSWRAQSQNNAPSPRP